jgi:hypothetical protein
VNYPLIKEYCMATAQTLTRYKRLAAVSAAGAAITGVAAVALKVTRRKKGPVERAGKVVDVVAQQVGKGMERGAVLATRSGKLHQAERLGRRLDKTIARHRARSRGH